MLSEKNSIKSHDIQLQCEFGYTFNVTYKSIANLSVSSLGNSFLVLIIIYLLLFGCKCWNSATAISTDDLMERASNI